MLAPHLFAPCQSGAFKEAIEGFGRVVVVMEPWNAPAPLLRAWCLWELLCAVEGGVELEIVLSPAQEAAFVEALTSDFDSISARMSEVDARKATAYLEVDLAMIVAAVEAIPEGYRRLNAAVFDLLRDWLADSGRRALAAMSPAERGTSPLLDRVAALLHDQSRLGEAEELFRETLAAKR